MKQYKKKRPKGLFFLFLKLYRRKLHIVISAGGGVVVGDGMCLLVLVDPGLDTLSGIQKIA